MEENYSPDIINLTDEDGKEYNFEILDRIETSTGRYVALLPLHDDPNEILDDNGDLVIAAVVDDGAEEYFEDITDDEEYNTVADLFIERLRDVFEIDEE